jgi:hypothetical protein
MATNFNMPDGDFGPSGGSIPPGDRTPSAIQKDQATNRNVSPAARARTDGPYVYPVEKQNDYKGKITFIPVEVNVPEFAITVDQFRKAYNVSGTVLKESESTYPAGNNPDEADARAIRTGADTADPGVVSTSASSSNKSIITYTPLDTQKITLHLPIAYVVNDAIGYENAELGVMGATGLNAFDRTGDMGSALGAAVGAATTSITDLFKQGMGANAARVAFARGVAMAPISAGLKAAGSIAARVVVNPNVRATFRGVAIREYSFQFKFIPYSQAESMMIADIIRTFRIHAYPEAIYAGPVAIGYKYPNLFKIRVQYGEKGREKDVGSRIKMCYLRNVQTTYNPTAASFHVDGSPTEIDLTLAFTEHTTISRADIDSTFKREFGGASGGETSTAEFDLGDGF